MYLINDVSKRVKLSPKRIREYEKEGFIKPDREPKTNNRIYSDFEISQILRINYLIHEEGFTLSCLRNLIVLAPCWNIFGCTVKEECAAFQFPHEACWKVRKHHEVKCAGPCSKCAIFINRQQKKKWVLSKKYHA